VSDVRVPAVRLRRPSWRDPRLVVGVLLVLVSVVVGARVTQAAGDTVPVYAAARSLASGQVVDASAVRPVRVHLGPGTAAYLSARRPPGKGLVLARPIGAGELVPVAALTSADRLARRPVGVPVPVPAPLLQPGGLVDLWSSARDPASTGTFLPPERLAAGAEVFAVAGTGGTFASTTATVQVLLDDGELKAVLDAEANGARLAVVPVPGGGGG